MILIDDIRKQIVTDTKTENYWLTSHYDPQEETKDVFPKNWWLGRKEQLCLVKP